VFAPPAGALALSTRSGMTMCGICGFVDLRRATPGALLGARARAMADALAHRGPDDRGVWVEESVGLAFGHRRLSIIDLSSAGAQPMTSASGRFTISYNGEVYNFPELRLELEPTGYPFRGHSDTEVLLAGFERWGIEATLRRAEGMFAFAVWDRDHQKIVLARDRAGKKPLYFGGSGDHFFFASELKALAAHPAFVPEIDRTALGLFIQYGWMPRPFSIYRGIRQLAPGCLAIVDPRAARTRVEEIPFWSARAVVEEGAAAPFTGSLEEAAAELERRLGAAVGRRMIADVPLGALLSGGIDSSTVVAMMHRQSERPVKTFTIGFTEAKYNEAPHAAAIAAHLGTDHTELYVTPGDALEVIPRLPTLYDEPFADVSQIPTFLVSGLARRHVTVALSGDGGDELFAGYNSYPRLLKQWSKRLSRRPLPYRRAVASVMRRIGDGAWRWVGMRWPERDRPLPRLLRKAAKMERQAAGHAAADPVELLAWKRNRCEPAADLVLGAGAVTTTLTDRAAWVAGADPLSGMQFLDFVTYLPDDLLVKVDRASMGHSLEIRCPLLDQEVITFAWRLPPALRLGQDGGKQVLKAVLARDVPRRLWDRPKSGFGVPITEWLKGPLRDWAETLIQPQRLQAEALLRADAVQRVWRQHLAGWHNHEQLLWSILMFQSWHETWRKPVAADARTDIAA
jgi:asparagine synthase (glutamine-hydrolysing)